MDIPVFFRTSLFLLASAILSGCLYYPDLKGESRGSLLGGLAAGIAVAQTTADITAWGAGTIVGSVFGGIIGQSVDNHSPLRLENPPNEPIPLFYYQTLRPPLVQERFYPGGIYLEKGGRAVELRPISYN